MWWRLLVLGGMFFGLSRAWQEDRPHYGGDCLVRFNRGNGHYYQFIPTSASFDHALEWSRECRFAGARGHLATIATRQEQDFLANQNRHFGTAWIAATDRDQEGVWKWVAGEEAGKTFFAAGGSEDPEKFSAWAEGEPNNRDEENCAVMGWNGGPEWNDVRGDSGFASGFLVEYTGLPEPEKLVITSGNTRSPFFGSRRPRIVGEKNGREWEW